MEEEREGSNIVTSKAIDPQQSDRSSFLRRHSALNKGYAEDVNSHTFVFALHSPIHLAEPFDAPGVPRPVLIVCISALSFATRGSVPCLFNTQIRIRRALQLTREETFVKHSSGKILKHCG
ncbi:hypothetical protein CDAR_539131 [Caerostris darwini]|uniref:Uncharacterized protein n=1 Tax=Caerostris darwini TaxID=1538125 RepID=A0AAV4T2T8_9ARAC|nr:hypothetical protein CDAR_539131 [Caerostris darwini]